MNYILKQFDEPLVKFSATTDTSEPEIQILWGPVKIYAQIYLQAPAE